MTAKTLITDPADPRLVDRLYNEAVALADESRTYFGIHGKLDRKRLSPVDRVLYTCESLRISTRVMHVISWLMVRKAVAKGEITEQEGLHEDRRLGDVELCRMTDKASLKRLPPMVASLSYRSQHLFSRAYRLEQEMLMIAENASTSKSHGARALINRLESIY